jgi:two-component system cell cycle sensor histidine kinase PleC
MSEVTAEMIERGRGADPRTTAQRRRLAYKVREARGKLTSNGTGSRVFDVELLRLFAESRKGAAPALVLFALGIGGLACLWVRVSLVLVWMSLVAIGMVISYGFAVRFLKTPECNVDVRSWRRTFALAEAIQGTLWAMIVILLLNEHDPAARTFVLFVLLLVAAMTAMISATIPIAVYGGLVPVMIAIAAFMIPQNDSQNLPLTLMACGAQLYFIVLAKRLYSTALATLSLSLEMEALIA